MNRTKWCGLERPFVSFWGAFKKTGEIKFTFLCIGKLTLSEHLTDEQYSFKSWIFHTLSFWVAYSFWVALKQFKLLGLECLIQISHCDELAVTQDYKAVQVYAVCLLWQHVLTPGSTLQFYFFTLGHFCYLFLCIAKSNMSCLFILEQFT